jgi:hypothetical protein
VNIKQSELIKNNIMERIVAQQAGIEAINVVSYEEAAFALEQESEKAEELSCNQLLKNLLMTNLRLLKLNDISAILLF